MYLNMDGTILSSWDRSIQLGQKTEKKLLKNIQARLPNRTDFFSIYKDGEEQLVLLCIGIVAMVYPGITSPIRSMLDFCRELSKGNLSVRIQDDHKDELSDLSGSMNHMADTIESLMKQQKSQEKKKRELELQMLQYQLNPHFLSTL